MALVERLLGDGVPATSRLTAIEVGSALTRRTREGGFSEAERDQILSALRSHFIFMQVIELSPEIADSAIELLKRHPLRAGDAVQLASCLRLQQALARPVTFVCFDDRLNEAARREGLALL